MMNPMHMIIVESHFAKCLPVARSNEIRLPLRSVTFIPKIILPSVAWYDELSMNASYSQEPKINKMIVMPLPKNLSPLCGMPLIIPAIPSPPKIIPTGATTTRKMMASIIAATTRIQNPP